MNKEFNRYEIERVMKLYSNDLLSAFSLNVSDSDKRNAISRAQSMLSDVEYLNSVASRIKDQIKECQKKLNDK